MLPMSSVKFNYTKTALALLPKKTTTKNVSADGLVGSAPTCNEIVHLAS